MSHAENIAVIKATIEFYDNTIEALTDARNALAIYVKEEESDAVKNDNERAAVDDQEW